MVSFPNLFTDRTSKTFIPSCNGTCVRNIPLSATSTSSPLISVSLSVCARPENSTVCSSVSISSNGCVITKKGGRKRLYSCHPKYPPIPIHITESATTRITCGVMVRDLMPLLFITKFSGRFRGALNEHMARFRAVLRADTPFFFKQIHNTSGSGVPELQPSL